MFLLHLCLDSNFVNQSYYTFEKYYPSKNYFLVNKETKDFRIIQDKVHFHGLLFIKNNFVKIRKICDEYGVDSILLHGLNHAYVDVLKYLFSFKKYRVYWIFWGYELYVALAQLGKYQLLDEKLSPFSLKTYMFPNKYNVCVRKLLRKQVMSEVLIKAIPYIDYFCFWNYADYKLLQKYFRTKIKFKFFIYSSSEREIPDALVHSELPVKECNSILINHQASATGNHYNIMKRIAFIDKENSYKKIVPLSYGSSYIRKSVLKLGETLFKKNFIPILEYMPQEEYFTLINRTEVAIMGARRQEAAGNIISLLSNGTKVFLREDNNLLQYYRERGFIIYSYDRDLNSIDDLRPLTLEEQLHNRLCRLNTRICNDQFMPFLIER